jgi:hypothetical protein
VQHDRALVGDRHLIDQRPKRVASPQGWFSPDGIVMLRDMTGEVRLLPIDIFPG